MKILIILTHIIVNFPLFYLFFKFSPIETVCIIGHSLNQFIFLLIFFPFILVSVYALYLVLMRYEYLNKNKIVKFLIFGSLASVSFAGVDNYSDPPDFYLVQKSHAKKAFKENKEAIKLHNNKVSMKTTINPANFPTLNAIYNEAKHIDKFAWFLEFLELTFVVFMLFFYYFLIYEIYEYHSKLIDENKTEKANDLLSKTTLPIISVPLLTMIWAIFRLINMEEIGLVKTTTSFNSFPPAYGFILPVSAIVIYAIIWKRGKTIEKASAVIALIGTIIGAILFNIIRVFPNLFHNIYGSSMPVSSLIIQILLSLVFGKIFWRETIEKIDTRI